ncbi:MAG: hypothetical protein PHY55_04245 [Bacteroidales bacterium]|nr:hypothetical protein [Bacteroidales bacterium]
MALLGSGTELDPYLLSIVDDLLEIPNYYGTSSDIKYFRLTNDIILPQNDSRFPISRFYYSVLDGGGYKLSDFTLTNSSSSPSSRWGIFKFIVKLTVKNLGIENFNIRAGTEVGAFAGACGIEVNFENCYVSNSSIQGYYYNSPSFRYFGGFIGARQSGTVVNFNNCFVRNCLLKGYSGLGGFIGQGADVDNFDRCYSFSNTYTKYIGNVGAFFLNDYNVATTSYYNGSVNYSQGATFVADVNAKDQSSFPYFDFENIWVINDSINDGYPVQKIFAPTSEPPQKLTIDINSYVNKINADRVLQANLYNHSYMKPINSDLSTSKKISVVIQSYINKINALAVNISGNKQSAEVNSYLNKITSSTSASGRTQKQVLSYLNKINSTLEQINKKSLSVDSIIQKVNTNVYTTRKQTINTLSFVDIINAEVIRNAKNYPIVQAWTTAIKTQAIEPNPRNIKILLDIIEAPNELHIEEYLNLLSTIKNQSKLNIRKQLNNISIIENPSYMEVV